MSFINVNGTKLHYRFDGATDLPVLVLSHSLGTDLSMWDLQIPEFTQHFRVFATTCVGTERRIRPLDLIR